MDWVLDLVAGPDPTTGWVWKDEDELARAHEMGLVSADDVAVVRAAGEEVGRLFDAGGALFERWAAWRPDPAWGPPSLDEL